MRVHLLELHEFMKDMLERDCTNIAVLYYYRLTCMLQGKVASSRESLKLLGQLHALNYQNGKFIVMDYFMTKANNILVLLAKARSNKVLEFTF